MRARYYDPNTGQFLSRDPAAVITHEPYGYSGGNPLNRVDLSGLCSWNPFDRDSCEFAETGKAITSAAKAAAPILHTVSSVTSIISAVIGAIATGCAGLAVAMSETGVGAIVFGGCAAGAAGISEVSLGVETVADVGLAVAGQRNPRDIIFDVLGLATFGMSKGVGAGLEALRAGAKLLHAADFVQGLVTLPLLIPQFFSTVEGSSCAVSK